MSGFSISSVKYKFKKRLPIFLREFFYSSLLIYSKLTLDPGLDLLKDSEHNLLQNKKINI